MSTSRVLIVTQTSDDSTQIAHTITRMGFVADTQQTTRFEVSASKEEYDLVLLNGDQASQNVQHMLQQMRSSTVHQRIGVIAVTDQETDEHLARLWELGVHDFITRPINALVLEARVKSVLQQQASLKKIDAQNALLELKMEELQLQKEVLTEQKTSIAQANEEITDSISYARRIQDAMLPAEKEIKSSLPASFILFRPRNIVSGNFYWFAKKQLADYYHKLILAVGDCTGQGVPGAFMSMIGDSLLNHTVHDLDIHEPDQILGEMDRGVWAKLHQNDNNNRDGMDLSLCMVDIKAKLLKFAGARQNLVYFQNNELFFIQGDERKIGGMKRENTPDALFQLHSIDVSIPTEVYLFTDGYQNQLGNDPLHQVNTNRFHKLLREIHHHPAQEQLQLLEDRLASWDDSEKPSNTNATGLTDDVLIWYFKLDL